MIIIPRAKRVYNLAARAKLDAPYFYISFLLLNVWLVPANDVVVMEHFAFPGNIDFAADSQGAFSCFIHEKLMCLFIVCETVFTIGESRAISDTNDTQQQHNKWLQFLAK